MKPIVLFSLLGVGLLAATGRAAGESPPRPNVIVIIADDMALGDIAAFNGGRTETPHIDRLIRESVWFNRGYSGSPVCAPARAALHTGRYAHRTGVVSLSLANEPEYTRLKRDEITIADVYARQGYATGLVGKWHIGLGDGWHPRQRGFQEFAGFIMARPSYFRYSLEIDGEMREFSDRYLTDELSAQAVDFVRRHRDRPFFLEVAHFAPHRPLEAPAELVRKYQARGVEGNTAVIYAMVEVLDRGIGKLLETLREVGLRERTIVVFVSDNGPDPLTGERFNHGLRGSKYQVYEGGIRVPFAVNWPGRLAPGERHVPVHFADLLPTLTELCGLPAPDGLALDGRSFASVLFGQPAAGPRPLFWQWNRGAPNYTHNAAMLDGAWKLVRPFVTHEEASPADSKERSVLYHLATDPFEATDLSELHRARFARMSAALDAWCREVEADRRRSPAPAALLSP